METGAAKMVPITERELETAASNAAIEQLRIQQLGNDKYSLVVKLTWRNHEQILITQRKEVRGWADLNRLMNHIRNKYRFTSEINVTLKGETK